MEKEWATGMRGNPTPATGQLSAALTIWAWILEHGRPPKVNECRNKNGLFGYDLYYRVFATSHFSAIIPLVSALCGAPIKMRQCLGWTAKGQDCPNTFPDQGAHVRFCESCRRHGSSPTHGSIPATVERMNRRAFGMGIGGWNTIEPWAQDIEWGETRGI